jgi:RNA polymerase sigma-70 factor, ECF subfamily
MTQTASYELLRPQTFFVGPLAESPEDPDYSLARAAAGGAVAAIGDLYERHNRLVFSLCLRMTRSRPEAEDLTQEVFVQLLRKIGTFRGESRFTSWLYRLTFNHVLRHLRHVSARKELIVEDVEVEISTLQMKRHSASTQVLDSVALTEALALLSPGCRTVIVLFDIEGYSHVEIARMLGFTVGTSKSQLHKARMNLRRLLESNMSKRS